MEQSFVYHAKMRSGRIRQRFDVVMCKIHNRVLRSITIQNLLHICMWDLLYIYSNTIFVIKQFYSAYIQGSMIIMYIIIRYKVTVYVSVFIDKTAWHANWFSR